MQSPGSNRVGSWVIESYLVPSSIQEAISILSEYEAARPIAGGTDLMVEKPPGVSHLVDVSRLGLSYIRKDASGLKIGACTTISAIAESATAKEATSEILTEAAGTFSSKQVANVATIGGNLCQGLPSANMSPGLIALDATVKIVGSIGQREIPVSELFVSARKTTLDRNELLTEIAIPRLPQKTAGAFLKLQRTCSDVALVDGATVVTLDEDRSCRDVRIVIGGGVAPVPLRLREAESHVRGRPIDEESIERAATTASGLIRPRPTSIRASPLCKIEMCRVLVRELLTKSMMKLR